MHRLALAAAALAALCLASPALAAGVPIRTEKLAKDTEAATMSVEYPVTGNAGVDAEVAAWAKGEFDNFAQLSTEDRQPDEAAYELEITFEVERNDATGFAVLFTEYTFTGGAHPNSDFTTFNYVMPEGWRVYLPEIFQAKALKTISSLAVAALKKDMGGDADSETIADGAGPAWDNFDDFTLKADRLDLNFSAYQVAAYAAGPQFVSIPLSKLKGLMRPDWKAATKPSSLFPNCSPGWVWYFCSCRSRWLSWRKSSTPLRAMQQEMRFCSQGEGSSICPCR
ncbi:MAG: DUF3298 domain-containing protein [Rhizobiales bacterium]|nr:DUF3298 domain-containing protein [Hyphomicrobiales bacterium]